MKRFGLIGYPLSHSFSGKYFAEKFERENISGCTYELFPVKEIGSLTDIVRQPDIYGLNVTIPYKISVIPFLNALDETAKAAGAVNTIKITREQNGETHLKGYNTDVFGFEMSLKSHLQPWHRKALVLGNGGAAKAVIYVLRKLGIDYIVISRTPDPRNRTETSYTELNEHAVKNFPLIINTTPLGMFPDTESFPAIPYNYLTQDNFLFDLVYNPEETLFLRFGREKGALVQNGLAMLKLQAEKAWEIWNH